MSILNPFTISRNSFCPSVNSIFAFSQRNNKLWDFGGNSSLTLTHFAFRAFPTTRCPRNRHQSYLPAENNASAESRSCSALLSQYCICSLLSITKKLRSVHKFVKNVFFDSRYQSRLIPTIEKKPKNQYAHCPACPAS